MISLIFSPEAKVSSVVTELPAIKLSVFLLKNKTLSKFSPKLARNIRINTRELVYKRVYCEEKFQKTFVSQRFLATVVNEDYPSTWCT